MDLDAVLARWPQLVLVDELAHTNAPGARHPKRHQDVEELLAAGIDVYTTLNIQHLDSLNDIVAQITGVVVRETIPDSVLDEATEIRLVDLPPAELVQRLREGRVYIPAQASRAMEKFFRLGNLTALREIPLRRTAERVDDQMRSYMQTRAIPGPWPAAERLLVCVSPSPLSGRLIRAARCLAENAYGEANRLNRLVGNLLDLTRLEAGALTIRREPSDLQDVIGAALQQVGGRLQEREVQVVVPPEIPLVPLDSVPMVQVLVNLVDNALRYSPPDQPIDVVLRAAGPMAEVEVSDRGPGIPAEDLEHIFDRFYLVQRSQGSGGIGLGLSICRGIVEAHRGTIRAQNRPGGGTSFVIALPQRGEVGHE